MTEVSENVAVIEVAAPPEVPRSTASSLVLPVVMSAGTLGLTGAAFFTGSPVVRNPTLLAFPAMMAVSLVVTALTGRGRRRGPAVAAARDDYLGYLDGIRAQVTELAAAQRFASGQAHPDPDTLWTLVGGPRMWGRRPGDRDVVRVGLGTQPLATQLVAARNPSAARCDPVTVAAMNRFLKAHSTVHDVPVLIALRAGERVTIDGDVSRVRGLLRAVVCQLAVAYAPEDLSIIAVCNDRSHWDWLKWLPHHAGVSSRVVVIADDPSSHGSDLAGATVLEVGCNEKSLSVTHSDGRAILAHPDHLDLDDAVVCARRLAAHHHGPARPGDWVALLGAGKLGSLRVPIGATLDGLPVHLDIKEAAQQGMGPHGLCVGATGSGKSELLRTIALGMMARNSPADLNLLLIDFKGGATFLDFANAPHAAAVITNLADDAPLVARMRDSLAGEMNRRQQLLHSAGAVSVSAYQRSRARGSTALPTLFIIVDEFSELLSQQPDFADVFVAIGRLGRSLGMHLLLASQRLDEGRLRGLEAHLSYRLCLKTLSAGESRTVLGSLDAYELPTTPGAGFLRDAGGELVRFQAALVSGPTRVAASGPPAVRLFTAAADPVAQPATGPSVMQTVLDGLAGQGPPAHRVWLPPLDVAPPLATLLGHATPRLSAVPIGIVDRPYDQCRTPLTVDLSGAAGNVAIVGAPRSGKSTALGALITALVSTHDPTQVQFYCLDFGGGTLSGLRELPHVGTVADRSLPDLVRRTVAHVESAVRHRAAIVREHGTRGSVPAVFLVVDGWAVLRQDFEALEETVTAIAGQGLSYGVHIVVAAARWADIRPACKDQLGTRIELRLGDPADSEIDRRHAREVPRDRPGRGLTHDGLHMLIAMPGLDEIEARCDGSAAPPVPLLPGEVDYDTLVRSAAPGILLGLGEQQLDRIAIDFQRCGHLLILGDNGCGKTATLRTLCREIVRTHAAARAQLFLVDFRRALLGVVESEHLAGYAMSPAALGELLPGLMVRLRDRMPGADVSPAQLRAGSWWTGPDIYVVVDDYDIVAASAGNPLLVLLEYLPYATDLGLHVVVARRSGGAARALFEPLLAGLRDFGCIGLMMSGRADEGALIGSSPPVPLPPGRGTLITRPGVEQLVQVAWSPPG